MAVLTSSQIVLKWSADPLSDTTPTYVTISNSEIRNIEWWAGIDREGNDPEPGGMVVTLKNTNRKWEPLFGTNTIDQAQRFTLTVDGVAEETFYSQEFDIDFPSGQDYSEVTITCGDGFEILAQDDLPTLEPPDAETYEDVVNFYEPWGFWTLGDPEGTTAKAILRTHTRGKGKKRRKWTTRHGTSYSTRAEADAVSGNAGVYKNTPTLGQDPLILGSTETSTLFTASEDEYVRVEVDNDSSMVDTNRLTCMAWVKPTVASQDGTLIGGPVHNGSALNVFALGLDTTPRYFGFIQATDGSVVEALGTAAPIAGQTTFVAFTWDGNTIRLYVDGVLDAQAGGAGKRIRTPTAGNPLLLAADQVSGPLSLDGTMAMPAVIERALTAEQIASVYTAGAERGYPEQDAASERIAQLAASASSLWSVSWEVSNRDVLPIMWYGQSTLDEITETLKALGPQAMFFFNGDGNAVILGHEWKASDTIYNTVQATFGDGGGTAIPSRGVELVFDSEVYNEVLASHEAGDSVVATDAASQAKRGRRVRTEETDLLLMEHAEVESLAEHVLRLYAEPAMRPVTVTIDGHHALAQIKTLDIGYLVRVQKEGTTGSAIDRVTHIIGKRKSIDIQRLYTCTYTLARGFDPLDGYWRAGIHGYSEATSTTKAA